MILYIIQVLGGKERDRGVSSQVTRYIGFNPLRALHQGVFSLIADLNLTLSDCRRRDSFQTVRRADFCTYIDYLKICTLMSHIVQLYV
jgi:hypothetical protein